MYNLNLFRSFSFLSRSGRLTLFLDLQQRAVCCVLGCLSHFDGRLLFITSGVKEAKKNSSTLSVTNFPSHSSVKDWPTKERRSEVSLRLDI